MRIGDSPGFQQIPNYFPWTQEDRNAKENLNKLEALAHKLPHLEQQEIENLIRNLHHSINQALDPQTQRKGIDEIGYINVLARQILNK